MVENSAPTDDDEAVGANLNLLRLGLHRNAAA
jgi:hypothetical protein